MATVIKKCDCADTRRCKHRWVVRYRTPEGRQREKTYLHDQKRLANDYALKVEHDKRAGVFHDPKAPDIPFGMYAEKVISEDVLSEQTRRTYRGILRNHLAPLADRGLRDVAADREGIRTLLVTTLPEQGAGSSTCNLAKIVITKTLNEAASSGHLTVNRIKGIRIEEVQRQAKFYVPTHEQIKTLVAEMGVSVHLMRGCGLRLGECLAVSKRDFREGGTVLRLHEQVYSDGVTFGPLKHRKPGQFRDVPVPAYVWDMVKSMPDGRLFDRDQRRHTTYRDAFRAACKTAGVPAGFTPHDLRHVFASVTLSRGVPITDTAEWLGHRNIQITWGTYGHLVPSAVGRARQVLDEEWSESA